MFNKILIANRGEIACRIMNTAQRMGIHCVAVYSEADAGAQHVKQADSAYCIGPAPSQESYLDGKKIIALAKKIHVDAIHPGYGFLAENAAFAAQCQQAGITFIGPSVEAIKTMGNKSAAKKLMAQAKVPVTPGYHDDNQDIDHLITAANDIGYPVLIKAVAGGGGKGMRLVEKQQDMKDAIQAAQREARSSFADDRVLIEKYINQPRHIEIQIVADQHGHCVHLFERDCSIQRRHQKIIEQAPAPNFSDELRQQMGQAAIAAAQAIDYVGAGTIEFLLDKNEHFYFMEMNTRLQVEHPVTEMITGYDLVEWQLLIAAGQTIPVKQEDIQLTGHAIEARIYAEDPRHDFLPSTGNITHLRTPSYSTHCRIDSGITEGDTVTSHYDPLIAKLIVWDITLDRAIHQLQRSLAQWQMTGIKNNVAYLHAISQLPSFIQGEVTTHFVEQHHIQLIENLNKNMDDFICFACFYLLKQQTENNHHSNSPWDKSNAWQMNQAHQQHMQLTTINGDIDISIIHQATNYLLTFDEQEYAIEGDLNDEGDFSGTLNDQEIVARIIEEPLGTMSVFFQGNTQSITLTDPWQSYERDERGAGHLSAPLPGTIVAVMAKDGQQVKRGDKLIVIEAMKMEHTLHAPSAGTVKAIHFAQGDQVDEGIELLSFEATPE